MSNPRLDQIARDAARSAERFETLRASVRDLQAVLQQCDTDEEVPDFLSRRGLSYEQQMAVMHSFELLANTLRSSTKLWAMCCVLDHLERQTPPTNNPRT
ncbi:MAG: hypothetical protein KF683_04990 [Rubrivivax sp.]|nr:hypothetical protein [Rubrivivax sp.]